tara:strand:+ start:399 stop:791 length:393 start_codon:yes stop_codon:yes gene_type:complete
MKNSNSLKKYREFGLLIGVLVPLIFGILLPIIYGHNAKLWTLWLGLISISLAFFQPRILSYPYKVWMQFGHVLGWINSRIILGFIYILVLLPIALFMRIFGYDPLKKKKLKQHTYRENIYNKKIDLNRIF